MTTLSLLFIIIVSIDNSTCEFIVDMFILSLYYNLSVNVKEFICVDSSAQVHFFSVFI